VGKGRWRLRNWGYEKRRTPQAGAVWLSTIHPRIGVMELFFQLEDGPYRLMPNGIIESLNPDNLNQAVWSTLVSLDL